jgi:hypothetical protein
MKDDIPTESANVVHHRCVALRDEDIVRHLAITSSSHAVDGDEISLLKICSDHGVANIMTGSTQLDMRHPAWDVGTVLRYPRHFGARTGSPDRQSFKSALYIHLSVVDSK